MKDAIRKLGLNPGNSVIIGSGILQALGIRKSKDIDAMVSQEIYHSLKKSGDFKVEEVHGQERLVNEPFEIGTIWDVLGKPYSFEDFLNDSIIIDGVRYITLDFLYRAKKSWVDGGSARPKDIEDIKLMEVYFSNK